MELARHWEIIFTWKKVNHVITRDERALIRGEACLFAVIIWGNYSDSGDQMGLGEGAELF